MKQIRLSRVEFPNLPSGFERPRFDVRRVSSGIVHLGVGGFHRAHMARYLHDLMGEDDTALGWGVTGAGLRAADQALLQVLAAQDGLYSLVEREGDREHRVVVGALAGVIDASGGSDRLLAAIDVPATRVVSVTVTENGYHLDRATKTLNFESPAIEADLADPSHARTVPGLLVEAYRRRRAAGRPAFTSLCCDNIQHNGDVLKGCVLTLADRQDPSLASWIEAHAGFPNSMVDRITPAPTAQEIEAFCAETSLEDRAALHAEIFRQWVIEDQFSAGRPTLERVGVQFVSDVAPYEFMKLRLLNTSHLAIAAIGQLSGYVLISETIEDALIGRYMQALMDQETGPTLGPTPGVDLKAYKRELIARFANRAIKDTTQRVNTDAPLNYLLDPIRDRLARDQPIALLALGLAAWCRRVVGEGEKGERIEVVHPMADVLALKAREGGADPTPLLSIAALFGPLGQDGRLLTATAHWLASIYENGMGATMRDAAERGAF